MTWLSTTRTTMSMAASSWVAVSSTSYGATRSTTTALAVESSAPAWVVSSGSSSVSAPWVAETIAFSSRLSCDASSTAHDASRIAADQVGRVRVEGDGDQLEEPVQLAQDHRLGEQRLGADLVVDGLPADAHHVGEPRHRHLGPAVLGGQRDRGVDRPARASSAVAWSRS